MIEASFTVGESFGALATFRYPVIFVEGPRGTAKSRSILSYFIALLLQFPGARLLLCRRYRSDLTKTILTTLEEEVFPSLGLPVPGGAHRNNRSEYRLDNGSVIWPTGIDDGMGILSMGVTFAYVAEVIEMTEEMVTDIAGGLRWVRSPERPLLPDYSQMILDANPGPPGHWVNHRAEKVDNALRHVKTIDDYTRLQAHNYREAVDPIHRWKRIITKHQDNPGYWDHDTWDFTPLGRSYVTQQLEGLTGYKRQRWLGGLWKSAEGSVYQEFDEDRHVTKPFNPPEEWPWVVWWDPGYLHPTAIIWMLIAPNGRKYIADEIVQSGLSVADHCRTVQQRMHGRNVRRFYADPHHAFNRTAQSTLSIADQARACGVTLMRGPSCRNSAEIEAQVNQVRQALMTSLSDGCPELLVFSTCTQTIRGFQTWAYKRTPQGEIPHGDDRFEDIDDDEMDCVRGLVATRPKFEQPKVMIVPGPKW